MEDIVVKPGYKTTEFWVTLVVVLANAVLVSGIVEAGDPTVKLVASIVAGLTALGYGKARTDAKTFGSL